MTYRTHSSVKDLTRLNKNKHCEIISSNFPLRVNLMVIRKLQKEAVRIREKVVVFLKLCQ